MKTPPKYSYQVIRSHKTAFERQVWEAVFINQEEADIVMNGKGEWGMNLVPVLRSHQDSLSQFSSQVTDKLSHIQSNNKRHRDDRIIANHSSQIQAPADDFSTQFQQRKRARKQEQTSKQHEGFKFTPNERSPILENSGARLQSDEYNFGSNELVRTMRQYNFSFSAVMKRSDTQGKVK